MSHYHGNRPAPLPQPLGKRPYQVAKERLAAMGKTQVWLSEQTGYSQKTISLYLTGKKTMSPNLSLTRKLCRFLKLTLDELYGTGPKHN